MRHYGALQNYVSSFIVFDRPLALIVDSFIALLLRFQLLAFHSESFDEVFLEDSPEKPWDLKKALEKSGVDDVQAKVGDIYQLGDSRLMVGDSTNPEHFVLLMGEEKADLCLTDPPYILDYLHAKRHGKPTDGFGAKRNRRYIGTDELPENFTELWIS